MGLGGLLVSLSLMALFRVTARWLDLVAWWVWLTIIVSYIATSPYITKPLGGFLLSRLCDGIYKSRNSSPSMWTALAAEVCKEASPHAVAIPIGLAFGMASYPMVVAAVHDLVERLPRKAKLAAIGLIVAEVLPGSTFSSVQLLLPNGEQRFPAARLILAVSACLTTLNLLWIVRRFRSYWSAAKASRSVHHVVAARIEEVQ